MNAEYLNDASRDPSPGHGSARRHAHGLLEARVLVSPLISIALQI